MNNDRFKFRVWDKLERKYIYDSFFLLDDNGDLYIFIAGILHLLNDSEKDRYIIEFCTGIKNENEKLIFEGDVLQGVFPKFPKTVVWKSGGFYFVNRSGNTVPVTEEYIKNLKLKIFGNIHEVEK